MILRSIRVEGWRCFASPVELTGFTDGLNVIFGPNGVGKSTLMKALARGLFDSHNVSGNDIKSLRPWGRQLNPRVTIEFEHGGDQFRLRKQFVSSAEAQLERRENGRYVPLAESRAADDRARELLAGEAPGRGATDARHWGLAQILWAEQGGLQIGHLADGTRATIREALGAQIAGPGTEALERAIADAYGRFFTAKGKLKSGAAAPAVVGLQRQLEDATAQRAMLEQQLAEFEERSRRIEDLRQTTVAARHREVEMEKKLRDVRTRASLFKDLVGQRTLHEKDVQAAETAYKNLQDRIDAIRLAHDERAATADELRRLREELPAQTKFVEQLEKEVTDARQQCFQIRARERDVKAAEQRARLAERYIQACLDRDQLENRVKQIRSDQDELEQLSNRRRQHVAPDRKTLRRISKVARARDDARLRLDAALITVHFHAEVDTRVVVSIAEQTGTQDVPAGREQQIQGAPEVAFRIPGVGAFRATGPTGSVDELRQQHASAQAEFEELTAGLGTTEMAALEVLCEVGEKLDADIQSVKQRIDTRLDGDSFNELDARLARTEATIREIEVDHAPWQASPPDPDALVQESDKLQRAFVADRDNATAAEENAQKKLHQAQQQKVKQKTSIASLESQAQQSERRLESLLIDGLDEAGRRAQLTQFALQRDAARGKLDQVDTQIAAFGDDPTKSLAVLERQLEAIRNDAIEADRKLSTESGRLEQIASEAPYSALATVEESVSRMKEEIRRHQLQMDAVRLLYETLAERKRHMVDAILGPIRVRASRMLQRIVGTRFEELHFDHDSLLASGILPRGGDETVSLDDISGGEQEQVHFAVRMALADLAFPDQRQLVVLDDVFTYTDTSRLARIVSILDEQADRFQIVLLTCHPERYRGLPNTNFFDLEEALAQSAGS